LSNWVIAFFNDPYARSFLEGLANWVGQVTGPTVTAAAGALWARSHAQRVNAERQRNEAEGDLLKPRGKPEPLSAEKLFTFHKGLLTAYGTRSLPAIKRDGTLRRYSLEAAELRDNSGATKPEVKDYASAIAAFLVACWEHTNRCPATDELRDNAKAKFPSALAALGRNLTEQEEGEVQGLGKRYLLGMISLEWLQGRHTEARVQRCAFPIVFGREHFDEEQPIVKETPGTL